MSDIRQIDLKLVDATILMVFLGCMRHRKATAVAREMGLTQPAVSHALKRLRKLYDDPLFLRRAHGLEPTSLARKLEPKIRRIVRLLSETLAEQDAFDPAQSKVNLRIGAFDYELSTILPDLIADLRTASPGTELHTFPLANRDALDALVDAKIDLAIGYFDFPKDSAGTFVADELCTETYVVAARDDHPLLAAPITLDAFAAAEHLLLSPFGPVKTMVDHALNLRGRQRNVRASVPSLFAALSVVERSDLVLTLPSRVASTHAKRFFLGYRPLPFEVNDFKLHAVRHARDTESALHRWLVDKLILKSSSARKLDPVVHKSLSESGGRMERPT